ncbi:MAG: TetR/AcrR family transcriptional regulator, lmrAB and yxaGH operons repressor, partial [Actinomycetota bacterium]|nr:TetR/AcrR family transcriptional regulator, lmrAB and yxaGH operons repressor [Actinomycetota bacterium]
RFLDLWHELLDRTNLSAGCAVLAVTVAAGDDELRDHAGAIFRTWTERLADLFVAGGMKKPAAREFAATVVSATEGAVVLSRAQQTREPFAQVSATLIRLAKR